MCLRNNIHQFTGEMTPLHSEKKKYWKAPLDVRIIATRPKMPEKKNVIIGSFFPLDKQRKYQ